MTNWQAGQQYTYTVTIKDGSINISQATITPWSNNEQGGLVVNDGNYTGPEKQVEIGGTVGLAVDLGLSIRWASHNVGASAPEEYGGLYGWGDPTGKRLLPGAMIIRAKTHRQIYAPLPMTLHTCSGEAIGVCPP